MGGRVPVSVIAELLGDDGPLASSVPGFFPRKEQQLMAEATAATIAAKETLIVEAGTGTGKTFAYLMPALQSGIYYTGHSIMHMIQLSILLGHVFIDFSPVFSTMHHNAEYCGLCYTNHIFVSNIYMCAGINKSSECQGGKFLLKISVCNEQ